MSKKIKLLLKRIPPIQPIFLVMTQLYLLVVSLYSIWGLMHSNSLREIPGLSLAFIFSLTLSYFLNKNDV